MAPTAVLTREVYDRGGRRLALAGSGRSGGEGTVYPIVANPGSLAKIYHPARVTPELRDKIAAMRARPPRDVPWDSQRHRSIAWAQELLFHDPERRRFAGFTMPRIDTDRFREAHLYFDPQDRIRRFGGGFTWRHLLAAATNVASAVAAIHAQGHRVGDLRETNVLVGPSALIALIDCDSFQIRDASGARTFHCRVGTAEYLPPELHGADFARDHDRTHADLFALGVLVFKLLMEGTHPYQSVGRRVDDAPSTEAKISRGLFAYEGRRGVAPPPFAPPYEIVPARVRALFRRCFVEGHRRPDRRPSASEWFVVLREEAKGLRACRANPSHRFGAHLRRCPWCALASARGADPFPPPGAVGRQVALPAAPPPRAARVVPAAARRVPTSPAVPPPVPTKTRWRALSRRLRPTRRRVVGVLVLAAVTAALASPLGHAAGAPRRTALAWRATAAGPCPFEPARSAAPPAGCRARWRLGPATLVESRSRAFFLVRRSTRLLEVPFAVRFSGSCEVAWIDSLDFNARAAPVCLGECPERIEVRSARGVHPLVGAAGVAARAGPLRCGATHRGSWTFDVGDARGRARLGYPGLDAPPLGL